MTTDVLSYAGWYFLPNLVTGYLQSFLYTIFIRAGDPKPAPGSPRYLRDRKRVHVFVILAYLLYTIYEADDRLRQAGDFYQALGVPHGVDDRTLQSRFRKLTVQYHPDKATGPDKSQIEAIYLHLKLARDVLIDPAKRFAYDRFGPDSLQWRGCKTIRDFVFTGVQTTAIYYIASGGFLVLFGVLGYLPSGMFWRYLVMAAMVMIEIAVTTRPAFPALLTKIINPFFATTRLHPQLLPFQMLTLLRKMSITFFIALSQLAPIFQGSKSRQAEDRVSPQQLDRMDWLANEVNRNMSRVMGLELSPFAGDEAAMKDLKIGLQEWLVQNTVKNDHEVSKAMERVLDQRRQVVERVN